MKQDYYALLGVSREASPEEIRRAYRKLAFELHPDRNGGSPQAEEAFKEVTAAYAVLGDPGRRAAYEAARREGRADFGPDFDPSQVFADLFRNPILGGLFSQLAQDFARQGLRFDEPYLRRMFSQHPGGVVFAGFVFAGPLNSLFSSLFRGPRRSDVGSTSGPQIKPKAEGAIARFFRRALPRSRSPAPKSGRDAHDMSYELPLSGDVLSRGGSVRVSVPGPAGPETYEVRIPAGVNPGTRLRLAGRGAASPGGRGDLYLEVREGG